MEENVLNWEQVLELEKNNGGEFICDREGTVAGDYTYKLPHPKLRAYAFHINYSMKNDSHIPAGECSNLRNMN